MDLARSTRRVFARTCPIRVSLLALACFAGADLGSAQDLADLIRHHQPDPAASVSAEGLSPVVLAQPFELPDCRDVEWLETQRFFEETSPLRQATMLQQVPLVLPRISVSASPRSIGGSVTLASRTFQEPGVRRSLLGQPPVRPVSFNVDLILGEEAVSQVTTDLGNLIRKSKNAVSTEVQKRTPIVHDPRVRSSRIGSLAASGSYWVPARADLDTAVSKIDSRLIDNVIIIPGPYTSLYGPAFQVVDFQLLQSPRYEDGNQLHGRSSFDHQSNGNQWLGLQSLWAGGSDWGVRGSYAHRLGSNYRAGDGSSVAADYESRAISLAYGRDLSEARSVEFSLLRLDQTDVEFPGFVFDINALVTDGYELSLYAEDPWLGDRSEMEIWYNRTEFSGDSRNPDKANQFPLLTVLNFDGTTNADVMSTGYRRQLVWHDAPQSYRFTVGHDLRMIKQEVNEDFSLLVGATPVTGTSPLPRSFSVNPGLFVAYEEDFCEDYTFETGARVDFVQTDITEDAGNLTDVGVTPPGLDISYIESVGTDVFQTDRWLWSIFGKLEKRYNDCLSGSLSLGYAQRPPTLTELYGAQQLLLVVQNGLNVTTGDPRLKTEKMLQFDVAVDYQSDNTRAGIRAFSGWGFDYITFENTFVRTSGPVNDPVIEQTSLRYVNTSLATLAGLEAYLEWRTQSLLTPFATTRYVDGRDRTRNGDFATRPADPITPSLRIAGLPRGFFAGPGFRSTDDSEPLPGISPLETRVGLRLRDHVEQPQYFLELSARIVDNQDRVARSLLEFETPGFTTWDLRGAWQPERWDSLTVYTGVENFTDKTYREHLDFRSRSGVSVFQPGVSFYFGADVVY